MCPVNGIRDLIQWRTGENWSNEFVYGLGKGGGFAYLKFNTAKPPRQVYWGISGIQQHAYLAGLLNATYAVVENRSFKFTWNKACVAVESGVPPVLGPLDMFHLHYYEHIYHRRHIPIHYVLLVGFDEKCTQVLDTDKDEIQIIPLAELEAALDVYVPGLGKRNRMVCFDIPRVIPPVEVLVRQSIADQCQVMLLPPVTMFGIPAMLKLASEIAKWPDELGKDTAKACLRQVREYLNTPPDLRGDHLTAGRDLYITFLLEAGAMTGLDFSEAIAGLRESIKTIPSLADAIHHNRLIEAAAHIQKIAKDERTAFGLLMNAVGKPA